MVNYSAVQPCYEDVPQEPKSANDTGYELVLACCALVVDGGAEKYSVGSDGPPGAGGDLDGAFMA